MEREEIKPRIAFARKLARKLIADLKIEEPPILIKDVIPHLKKTYDLTVYPWSFGENTDGIQITEGDSLSIAFNQSQHSHRKRFTIAHEIGHLLIGHTRETPTDLYSDKPGNIEANQFAAELLMPLKMIKKDFQSGNKEVGSLAKRYFVSEEAMWWHLLEHKFLNRLKYQPENRNN